MSAIRSRAGKIAAVAAGFLLLVALPVGLLHTPPVKHFLLRRIEQALSNAGVDVQVSRLNYNLLDLSVSLSDVVVRSQKAPDLPAVATIESLRAEVAFLPLLSGNVVIEDGLVRNPALHLVFGEQGRDNIPRFQGSAASGSSSGPGFFIDRATVSEGSLVVESRPRELTLRLPRWSANLNGRQAARQLAVGFHLAEGGRLEAGGTAAPVRTLEAQAVVRPDAVKLNRLLLAVGQSRFQASGTLTDFSKPQLNVHGEGTIDLAFWGAVAGLQQDLAGAVRAEFTAEGPLDAARVHVEAKGADLAIRDFERVDLAVDATYRGGAGRVQVDDLRMNAPAGSIRAEGTLALTQAAGRSEMEAQVENLNLRRLTSLLDSRVVIASRATGSVSAAWPGLNFSAAGGKADLKLDSVRAAPARGLLPVSGQVQVNAGTGVIRLSLESVRALHARLRGRVIVEQHRVSGRVTARTSSVGQTLDGVQAILGRVKPMLPVPVSGTATLEADLGGTLEDPTARVRIQAPSLAVGDLGNVALQARMGYRNEQLIVRQATLRWRDQALQVAGRVGLRGASRQLNLSARLPQGRLQDLLSLAGWGEVAAGGVISAEAQVRGSMARPQAEIELSGENLAIGGQPLGAFRATAVLRDDLLRVPAFDLRQPQAGEEAGSLHAEGVLNLQTGEYRVQGTGNHLAFSQVTLPNGMPITGKLNVSAEGQGTLERPQLRAEVSIQDARVRGNSVGDFRAQLDVLGEQAAFEATAPLLNLAAQGHVRLEKPYPATLQIRANGAALVEDIPFAIPGVPAGISGVVTAAVHVTGPLAEPAQLEAVAQVSRLQIQAQNRSIRLEEQATVTLQDERLTVEPTTIALDGARVRIGGALPLEPEATGALQVEGTFDLATLLPSIPGIPAMTAKGQATVDLALRGSLRELRPDGEIVLRNAYLDIPVLGSPVRDLDLKAEFRNGALVLQSLSAQWAEGGVQATGRIPLKMLPDSLPFDTTGDAGAASLKAEVTGIRLGAIDALPGKVGGTASFTLEAQAPRPELDAVSGRVLFSELQAGFGGVEVAQATSSLVKIESGVADFERVVLVGPGTHLEVSGELALTAPHRVDLQLKGEVNAAAAAALSEDVTGQGEVQLELAWGGTLHAPEFNGSVSMSNGMLALEDPVDVAAEDLDFRLQLAGNRIDIEELNATLNGGQMRGVGGVRITPAGFEDINLAFDLDGVYLEPIEGLQTEVNAGLYLQSKDSRYYLGGQAYVLEGYYGESLHLEGELLRYVRTGRRADLTRQPDTFLSRLDLGVQVRTVPPIIIDNNLAEAAITADLRIAGSYDRPGLVGRMRLEEGGELFLGNQTFLIDRGVITFLAERRIRPELDIVATTETKGYDISLLLSGEAGNLNTTLTSNPPLPETDIAAVLLLGRTLEETRGAELEIAREQVLSYLATRLGGELTREAEQALGLTEIRLEPNLIAAEDDPSARLTIGKDVTKNLELIYSTDLVDSGDQIWIAEYELTKRFLTKAVKQKDNSFRFEFRHDVDLGGRGMDHFPGLQPTPKRNIDDVSFSGDFYFPEWKLRDVFAMESGDRYDFFKIRDKVDKLENFYEKRDFLEARIRMNRQVGQSLVDLKFDVDPGARIEFAFEGWRPPREVRKRVRRIWAKGVFDMQRANQVETALREELLARGYVRPEIRHQVIPRGNNAKLVLFETQPGAQFPDVEITFPGATVFPSGRLRELLKEGDLSNRVFTEAEEVRRAIVQLYRQKGYLRARVLEPRIETGSGPRAARIAIPVEEGPAFRVARLRFQGNNAFPVEELRKRVPLEPGERYRPDLREQGFRNLQDFYWRQGYTGLELDYSLEDAGQADAVDVVFQVREGRQRVIAAIDIEGRDVTSASLVRSQLEVRPGDVLNNERLVDSRRNLYRTGAYALADIEVEPVEQADRATADGVSGDGSRPGQMPVRLKVRVQEVAPFHIRYGAFGDTERGPGFIADLSNRNMLGSARILGLRTRYDHDIQEARIYFTQPWLRRFPIQTDAVTFLTRERRDAFITNRLGVSLRQETLVGDRYRLSYGYRIERILRTDLAPPPDIPPPPERMRIAPLTFSVTRETRNDSLNATDGAFLSQAVEYGAAMLGSQQRFYKYFGQYFRYIPLAKPTSTLYATPRRAQWVYAGAVRAGFAGGLGGQQLSPTERFFAGGGTTIRGFEQNGVGPRNANEDALGGNAVLIINNELRFPIWKVFGGVGFVDIGNVYRTVSDFDPTDLRKAAGIGMRLNTPYFVLRADWGFKLDRRPGETSSRFFFSIGQAF